MKRITVSLIALLAALPAQGQDIELAEIVISALRTASERLRTGVSVTVVDAEELGKSRDTSVATALSRIPGIAVATSGPFGNTSSLRIRGADGRYLAVYIDGIRVSDPSGITVSYDWAGLTPAGIAKIEVLRGSQSALWGGSAVGGVINITTRGEMEDGTHQTAVVEAGSFGTGKLSYSLTRKSGGTELAFSASAVTTTGFSAGEGGVETDGADTQRLSFSIRHQVSDSLAVGGSAFWTSLNQNYDEYVDTDGDYIAELLAENGYSQSRVESGLRAFAELDLGSTLHVFDVTLFDVDRTYVEPAGNNTYTGQRLTFGWQGTTEVSPAVSFVYGVNWSRETARYSNLPGGVADTELFGAFGQVLWSPSDTLDLSATLRADRNSAFGTFQTGRLAMAWSPASGTTLRASVATGFRAPSVDERFGDYPEFFFTGNPDLSPEESLSYEIGAEQAFANGATMSATLFRLEVDNLIASSPPFYATLDNLQGVSVRKGLELSASLPVSEGVTFGLAYTYTDGRRPDDSRLIQVPMHQLSLTLDADLADRLSAGLALTHVADRIDNDAATFARAAMPDYTVLNAQMSYDLNDTTEVYLKVENLLDENYQQVNGYAAAGRAVYVGLQAKF